MVRNGCTTFKKQLVGAPIEAPARFIEAVIRLYQLTRAFRPSCCRFYPSCSDYCLQAIDAYGLLRGALLTFRRLLKCHPWHPGGIDLVSVKWAYSAALGEDLYAAAKKVSQ